jgi:hypothetical protein
MVNTVIQNLLFMTIAFVLGRWLGTLEGVERGIESFHLNVQQGEMVYKHEGHGWIGSPEALEEIREQVDKGKNSRIVFIRRTVDKMLDEIKKDETEEKK